MRENHRLQEAGAVVEEISIPMHTEALKFLIAVADDPNRNNAYVMSNDGPHGDWTAKAVP